MRRAPQTALLAESKASRKRNPPTVDNPEKKGVTIKAERFHNYQPVPSEDGPLYRKRRLWLAIPMHGLGLNEVQ